ncbi:MAG: RsmE family RNA methyltransferase [Spirochaetia bacterium]|jgi:16S rRNA (uracil1498-N3)-methyltransferase
MKLFLLPQWYAGEHRISLSGGDFRHVARALRMRDGDTLPAVDSRGAQYEMRIVRMSRAECEVQLAPRTRQPGSESSASRTRGVRITLIQCLPKGRKIDLIVRQATEAGVARIVLLVSEHAVPRPGEDDGRVLRLRRIAREAAQQSGAPVLPEIEGPRPFTSIEGGDWGTRLLFHEKPMGTEPLHALLAGRPRAVSLLVGPEGGLSEAEVARARAAGFRPVHFATGILRVETAATYALGAVMTILQERSAWIPAQAK